VSMALDSLAALGLAILNREGDAAIWSRVS
jgi:hypothetical protein